MKVKIYVLADPKNSKIRYIGITINTLERRLYKHLDESRYSKRKNHKINWVRSLLSRGDLPIIREIAVVDSWETALELEKRLIKKYKKNKRLVNCEDFQESGRFGKLCTPEVKDQISTTLKRYFKTNKHPQCKCIKVYDFTGKLVGQYESLTICAKELNLQATIICSALKKRIRQYKGYLFRYCDDEDDIKPLTDYNPKAKQKIPIIIIDTWKNEKYVFESFSRASDFLKITVGTMSYIKKSMKRELFRYRYKIEFDGK